MYQLLLTYCSKRVAQVLVLIWYLLLLTGILFCMDQEAGVFRYLNF
ncbi:MAG: hypothetical protein KDC44_10515 [Phaeodactylibacter sp.]|nr:hypothetical protein [Phaeodactylibacter sp.]